MKKTFTTLSALILAAMLTLGAAAQTANAQKSKAKAPKSDADIQSCIQDKLAKSAKLKDQGFQVTVANGEATFTGTAKNGGSKGSVSGIAKSCGAKKVTNNITVTPPAKPMKTTKK